MSAANIVVLGAGMIDRAIAADLCREHPVTLEAFNTDGVRTLLKTTPTPYMVEKTLRLSPGRCWPAGSRGAASARPNTWPQTRAASKPYSPIWPPME